MRPLRSIRILGVALSLLVLSATPVAARTPVDPGTLNPAPPDFFNAVCTEIGTQIVCDLAFSDPDLVDEPSGIICGTVEILFSQSRSVVGKRFYDAAGNLTKRHFRETFSGTLTNPVTGAVVEWVQHDTVIHDLAIAGDLLSGTVRSTGLLNRAWLPGGGTVLTDVGTVLRDASTGEVIRSGGHHPFEDYFVNGDPSALAALCGALS